MAGHFNRHFQDECLNERWFADLAYETAIIHNWQREHNVERPKKELSGLPLTDYAEQVTANAVTRTHETWITAH